MYSMGTGNRNDMYVQKIFELVSTANSCNLMKNLQGDSDDLLPRNLDRQGFFMDRRILVLHCTRIRTCLEVLARNLESFAARDNVSNISGDSFARKTFLVGNSS